MKTLYLVIVIIAVPLILAACQTGNKTTTTELLKPSADNFATANGHTKNGGKKPSSIKSIRAHLKTRTATV